MEDSKSYEVLDDLNVDELLEHAGYQHVFDEFAEAAKGKFTRAARASAAMEVNTKYTDAEAEAAYQWGDSKFRQMVMAIPARLPLEEFKKQFQPLRLLSRHLRFLGGLSLYIERQQSKRLEDAHWHRFRLMCNRITKSKSPARKAWLEENQARHNQIQNEKRKAKRAEARAVKKIAKAMGVK